MYCQKCGSKVYKRDKYCGHCGKSILHKEKNQARHDERAVSDVYRHNLDAVFGYASSSDIDISKTEEGTGVVDQAAMAGSEKVDRNIDSSQEKPEESLKVRTFNFAKQVFTKPHDLIQSKDIYPVSLLWLYISIILFIGSLMTVNSFDAAFYSIYYFNLFVYDIDLYYLFPSFIWNIAFLILIYTLSVIINTVIKLRKEYEIFNFRDIVILSSLAMSVSTIGSVLILLNLTWLGLLLSHIGILAYIASPFLLSVFYIWTGRTKFSAPKPAAISLVAITVIIFIFHISVSTY